MQFRPFPPPALASVPLEYIIKQLHSFADQYWDRPDTADCTLIVPFPNGPPPPALAANYSIGPSFDSMLTGGGGPRRATQPPLNAVPRISLHLHVDYLSAHSTYLRGLFSGAMPLDLMHSATPPRSSTGVPPERLPRLMPSSPDHPILFLPVPDPTSLYLLIHWMYFGDLKHIEECLMNGAIHWDGIARNVEYLGLSAEMKVFLGRWYHQWLDADRCGETSAVEANEGTVYSDSDSESEGDLTADEGSEMSDDEELLKPSVVVLDPSSVSATSQPVL